MQYPRSMLILFLGLWSSLPSYAGSSPMETLQSTFAQHQQLNTDLHALVRRSLYPGTPGAKQGKPNSAEVQNAEKSLLSYRETIQRLLWLPQAPYSTTEGLAEYFPSDNKVRAIDLYFQNLSELASLKLSRGERISSAWLEQTSLQTHASFYQDFPPLQSLKIDRRGEYVSFSLDPQLVLGIQLGLLADRPNSDGFLTVMQYLSVRQVLENLASIQFLKKDHRAPSVQIPDRLRNRLSAVSESLNISLDRSSALLEEGAREALLNTTAQTIEAGTPFTTRDFSNEIAEIIAQKDQRLYKQLLVPLYEAFIESESKDTKNLLEQNLKSNTLLFSAAKSEERLQQLKRIYVDARASAILNRLLQLSSDGLLNLNTQQRQKILDQIEMRKLAYTSELNAGVFSDWLKNARTLSEKQVYDQKRADFIQSVTHSVGDLKKNADQLLQGRKVDFILLAKTFQKQSYERNTSSQVFDWITSCAKAETFAQAQETFRTHLKTLTAESIFDSHGIVQEQQLESYLKTADLKPKLKSSHGTSSALSQRIFAKLEESRKKDIRDFFHLAHLMGLNRNYSGEPSLQQILPDSSDRETYSELLHDQLMNRLPLLTQEISYQDRSGKQQHAPLFTVLAESQSRESAETLIDRAIDQTEVKAKENIQKIANTTSIQDLEHVLESSVLLELMMKGFPEFSRLQDQYIEDLLTPNLTDQFMRKYVGQSLSYGFGGLMLLQISRWAIKPARPWIDVVQLSMKPFLHGFMRAALALVVADSVYQFYELKKVRSRALEREDLFQSSIEGANSLFDYSAVHAADTAYTWGKWMFIGRVALDTAFFYFPEARQIYRKVTGRILTQEMYIGDIQAFETLKLKPGQWKNLDSAYSSLEGARTPEVEQAYQRLKERVTRRMTWELPEDHGVFKKIKKILSQHQRKKASA